MNRRQQLISTSTTMNDSIEVFCKKHVGKNCMFVRHNKAIKGILVGHDTEVAIVGLFDNSGWHTLHHPDILLAKFAEVQSYAYADHDALLFAEQ